jgi:hypothetical protein
MKRTAAALLLVVMVSTLIGCGGGSQPATDTTSEADIVTLLVDSTKAMSDLSGYRMAGTIDMDSGIVDESGQSQPINMGIEAEAQNSGGDVRQHMILTMSGYEVEAYIVGGVYYQNVPGQGWMKMSTGAYKAQNMNLGLVDMEQMEIMADFAQKAEIIEENDDTVGLSIELGQDYFEAALDLYIKLAQEGGEELPQEWLDMMKESISDFSANIRVWLRKSDNLMVRMEMNYTIVGLPNVGDVSSSMQIDFLDYNADIVIELPEEAKQAQEYNFTQ